MQRPSFRLGWELWTVAAILTLYVGTNVAIVAGRPHMQRTARASATALLAQDRSALDKDLLQWRKSMLENGRWFANLVGVVLESHADTPGGVSQADIDRLRTLTATQVPTARIWVFDARGAYLGGTTAAEPSRPLVELARRSLARDTTIMAATELAGRDLRLGVASPVRSGAGHGFVAVLDVSASDQLRRQLPTVAWEGYSGRTALTFPFSGAFVGATWSGKPDDPQIGWPRSGWSLDDSSLLAVGGQLSDTTLRFELAIPRSAMTSLVETRVARLRLGATLATLVLCLAVLLVARANHDRKLGEAKQSLVASELRAAQAEAASTRAQLAATQARINPHFLSNALHSVSALVASDAGAAEDALDQIGDLFRYSLEQSERHAVRLADEWQFVTDYLGIEQMRFGSRLSLEMHLDPELADSLVPTFVLQPLVENAIRHGIAPRTTGGTLCVTARRNGDRLELVVQDDGPGTDAAQIDASPGTGLRTLRQRLILDELSSGSLSVVTEPGVGFRIAVSLPIRQRDLS